MIRKRPEIKQLLDDCECSQHTQDTTNQWQTYLVLRAEDLVEHSCYVRTARPYLKYGADSGRIMLRLLRLLRQQYLYEMWD